MAMCKLTFVVLAVMLLCAQGLPRHSIQKRENMTRLCGPRLVEMLALVCNSIYYDPSRETREQTMKRNFRDSSSWEDSNGFKNPLDLFSYRSNRNAGGIVDECCKKSCSLETLISYCGTPINALVQY